MEEIDVDTASFKAFSNAPCDGVEGGDDNEPGWLKFILEELKFRRCS